jgi:integrase
MRRGEILGLTWDMVDLDEGMIRLPAEITKTNRGRDVPLNEEMIEMLRKLRAERDNANAPLCICPYVFIYKGQSILEIKRAFNSACRRAGIKDFHFHDLRHCFVTDARRSGVHDFVIMAITGHTTFEMFKRYNKVDREDLKNGINSIGKNKKKD